MDQQWGRCNSHDHTCKVCIVDKADAQPAAGYSSRPQSSMYSAMDQKVNIVSRVQWGAVPPKKVDTLKGPAQKVVIHHTALAKCKGWKECSIHLLSIQRSHMTERNFDDIGYNFLIGADGTVYEGRGWDVSGAHAKGNNHDSLGVAFMGNFNIDAPSMEAVSAVKLLLQSGVSQGLLHPDFVLKGHRDLDQTECPGEKLYVTLSKLK